MDAYNPSSDAGPSRHSVAGTLASTSTSSSPSTPNTKARRRSWFGFASPSGLTPSPGRSKTISRRGSKEPNLESLEMEDSPGRAQRHSDDCRTAVHADGEDDSWIAAPTSNRLGRKKSKAKKTDGQPDDGEAVKMDDLSSRSSKDDASLRKAYDPGGPPRLQRASLPPRTFSRTASGRDQPVVTLNDSDYSLSPTLSKNEHSPVSSTLGAFPERTSTDRPLPPIPNDNVKALPSVPHGIVVTPSSPRKLSKKPAKKHSTSSLVKERKSDETRRSRSASRPPSLDSRQEHRRSFNLGIGLPRGRSDSQDPPPVPSKPQSVSSPLPSRGPSPVPRIVFAEPDMPSKEGSTTENTEKRARVRRARSLSGLLSKTPVVDGISSRSGSRPASPVETEQIDDAITVKASGVLGWFGVKKTVKRRQSEGKLRSEDPVWPRSKSPIGSYRSATQSRESLGLPSTENTSRRPSAVGSSSTALPADGSSSRRAVFGRRPSSRDSDHSPGPHPDSKPIPIKQRRPRTANSSQSSLQLPVIDQSPAFGYFQADSWTQSPGEEETLFSADGSSANWGPGVRPWMDGMEGGRKSTLSSPLVSLPELAPVVQPSPTSAKPPTPMTEKQQQQQKPQQQQQQGGRLRSWSDAPRPQQATRPNNSSHPDLPQQMQTPTSIQSLRSASPLPLRPKLAHRPSSNNSAIMDRMRGVFSKTTSRSRSKTLSRQPSSEVDDFGAYRIDQRPGSSASVASDALSARIGSPENAQHALLGLSGSERHIFSSDTPDRTHRASIMSNASAGAESVRSVTLLEPAGKRKGRVRASTLSAGPTTRSFRPSSPQSVPLAATPPRRRPSVMQRLSNGVLRSGPSSPRGGGLFPLPPKASGSLSSSFQPTPDDASSARPRSSAGSVSAAMGSTSLKAVAAREDGETPELWLKRVSSHVGRDEIANVLAASSDEFHSTALRLFMSRFDFTHNALDVALRRLLMHMSLPRETQQIDRIIEAFSVRYEECEPGLFTSKDNTYVLAFSMMMLHTDAFNKHNKNKMTKPDYVRNTRMDNVPPLVLEAFFDNITFTPFVFFEDDAELIAATASKSEPSSAVSTSLSTTPTYSAPLSAKSGKVDVYHMIVRDLLGSLRVQMEHEIPPDTPFSCLGTRPILDTDVSHRAFVEAKDLAIVPPRRKSSTGGLLSTTPSKTSALPDPELVLKVTKASVLFRKDDEVPGKKARKWKSWSVILTGSQLLFFKDSSSVQPLMERLKAAMRDKETGKTAMPRLDNFKPDEVFPVKDCIAIYDRGYTQNPHTFRFVMPHHRQYLLQASDEFEMNEWITLINYASAFKTANLRIRGTAMGKDRAVLAGAAAAASHKREMDAIESPSRSNTVRSRRSEADPSIIGSGPRTPRRTVFGDSFSPPPGGGESPVRPTIPRSSSASSVTKIDGVGDVVDEGEQLEEVFDAVKAELAAGRGSAGKRVSAVKGNIKPSNGHASESIVVSRAEAIQAQVKLFEAKVKTARTILNANLRTARNLAILTPFQKITRDRIAQAVPQLSQKIRNNRLDIARLQNWIDILRRDAFTEQREMARVRHVALQAAAKSLRDPLGVHGVVQDVNSEDGHEAGVGVVPVLALPDESGVDDEDGAITADVFGKSPAELPVVIRQASERRNPNGNAKARPTLAQQSSTRSYRSSSSLSDLNRSSSELPIGSRSGSPGDIDVSDTQLHSGSGSAKGGEISPGIFNLSDVEEGSPADHSVHAQTAEIKKKKSQKSIAARNIGNGAAPGRRSVESQRSRESLRPAPGKNEEAEDWMKTRAARRVSLATIPDLHRVASGASAKAKAARKASDKEREREKSKEKMPREAKKEVEGKEG